MTTELQEAVDEAIQRVGRRPGLLVVGATDGTGMAFASRGPLPDPLARPSERSSRSARSRRCSPRCCSRSRWGGVSSVRTIRSSSTCRAGPVCRCAAPGPSPSLISLRTPRSPEVAAGIAPIGDPSSQPSLRPPLAGGRARGAREEPAASPGRRAVPILELGGRPPRHRAYRSSHPARRGRERGSSS